MCASIAAAPVSEWEQVHICSRQGDDQLSVPKLASSYAWSKPVPVGARLQGCIHWNVEGEPIDAVARLPDPDLEPTPKAETPCARSYFCSSCPPTCFLTASLY